MAISFRILKNNFKKVYLFPNFFPLSLTFEDKHGSAKKINELITS
jgi:hypothetical protein